jgi:hypothetical protein
VGTATIKDDGTGTIFNGDGTVNTTATKDDDRALTVNNITVNEAAPTAVFEVSGAAGQLVSLELANVTTTGLSASLQYYNGSAWVTYTTVTVPLNSSGKLLVRNSLTPEQEKELDNGETFTLTATNTGGTAAVGTATIKDDGTGTVFNGDGTENTILTKDDDRPLTVNSIIVNEASPTAVLVVSGAAGQLARFLFGNSTTTGLPGLQYFNGSAWVWYAPGAVALNSSGKLLVRTPLTAEQEFELKPNDDYYQIGLSTGTPKKYGFKFKQTKH